MGFNSGFKGLMQFQCHVRVQLTSQARQEATRKQRTKLANLIRVKIQRQLTKSTQQSPSSEADSCSTSQKMYVHCHVHNSPTLVSTQKQTNTVENIPSYSFVVHF